MKKKKKESSKEKRQAISVLVVSLILVATIFSIVYYFFYARDKVVEYPKDAYDYLYEVADEVIDERGVDISKIPSKITEYKISYLGEDISFSYGYNPYSKNIFAKPARLTVTLNKDMEVKEIVPNYESKEKYEAWQKFWLYFTVPFAGILAWLVLISIFAFFSSILMLIVDVYDTFID